MSRNKYGGHADCKTDKRVYNLWYSMLRRCYDIDQQKRARGKSYAECKVCERWMTLSNFAEDVQRLDGYEQWRDYHGYCLDKDTLVHGNKEYSPRTCRFIPYTENIREANRRTNSIKAAQESHKTVYYLKKDGVTLIFESEHAACKYLGVRNCSVSSCRRRGSKCKGYTVSCAKMDGEDGKADGTI